MSYIIQPGIPIAAPGREDVRVPRADRESFDVSSMAQVTRHLLRSVLQVERETPVVARSLPAALASKHTSSRLVQLPDNGCEVLLTMDETNRG